MLRIQFEERTHVGMQREENQDHMGHFEGPAGQLFVVCDGMGGHAGGSIASQLAVKTIGEVFAELGEETEAGEVLRSCIESANGAIHAKACEDSELRNMGTTCVAMLVSPDGETGHIAHVGDSRIYRIREGEIERLTRDHTAVQHLIDQGLLTEEQAALHPRAHVINRSLGVLEFVEVEVGEEAFSLADGERFLLCSDGLTGLVEDHEAYGYVATHPLESVCGELVDLANARGGYDNVTVQVVQVGEGVALTPPSEDGEVPEVKRRGPKRVAETGEQESSDATAAGQNWTTIMMVTAALALVGLVVLYLMTK